MTFAELIERRPSVGIVASITGFSTSLLTLLQQASIVIGFVGACFGLCAGYYTFRIKRRHWEREVSDAERADRRGKEAVDRKQRQDFEAKDRQTRNDAE